MALHLTLAAVPLLAISAHVFGWVSLRLSTALVLLPLLGLAVVVMVCAPHRADRVVLAGVGWGLLACGVYDLFRWDTVYLMGWWGDFIPTVGGWLTGRPGGALNAAAGYVWRYVGDGGGLGATFFVVAAALGWQHRPRRVVVPAAVGFAVAPVWAGLIATVGLAPRGQAMMFRLNPTTVVLSLVGHLIFGAVLGLGFCRSAGVRTGWPWTPVLGRGRPAAWSDGEAPDHPRTATAAPTPPPRPTGAATATGPTRVLIVGGGAAGLGVARRLDAAVRRGHDLRVGVIDPDPHTTYQSLLPEVAGGAVEPRHLRVALRAVLPRTRVLTATVESVDDARRRARIRRPDGTTGFVAYDVLVLAPGSVARTPPAPGEDTARPADPADSTDADPRGGVAPFEGGFRTVEDAVAARDRVVDTLERAVTVTAPADRARMLTVTVVGGGFAGVEMLGELEALGRRTAARHRAGLGRLRWHLVHGGPRLLPELSACSGAYAADELAARGVTLHLGTQVVSTGAGTVELDDGTRFASDTVLWTAGTRPHPLIAATGLPHDAAGRLRTDPTLQVVGHPHVFAAGDAAAVPDLTAADPDATAPPTAQHAVPQARVLAANVLADHSGLRRRVYAHADAGSMATLGARGGVAEIHGQPVSGWLAWALYRAYHLVGLPTGEARARVGTDWLLAAFFGRDLTVPHASANPERGRGAGPVVRPLDREKDTPAVAHPQDDDVAPAPSPP